MALSDQIQAALDGLDALNLDRRTINESAGGSLYAIMYEHDTNGANSIRNAYQLLRNALQQAASTARGVGR